MIERQATNLMNLKAWIHNLELSVMEEDVLFVDIMYVLTTRCGCKRANGECTCFDTLTPHRIETVALRANVSREYAESALNRIMGKSELRDFYEMEPFAPELLEAVRMFSDKSHNLPAPSPHRRRKAYGHRGGKERRWRS